MSAAQWVTIYSYWSGFASPCHHADWVKIEKDGGAYRRTAGLSQCVDSVNEIDIAALQAVIDAPAVLEIQSADFGLPEACVASHYRSEWTDDHPQMQVDVVLEDGTLVRLKSAAQHSFMLPWRIEWLNTPRWIRTYNHRIAVAIHALLPEEFLNRERLTRAHLESDAKYQFGVDVPKLREEPEPPSEEPPVCTLPRTDPNWFDERGQTRLMCVASPPFDIKRKIFDDYVSAGVDVNAKRYDGCTGLFIAALGGETQAVRAWLAAKADPNIADKEGISPLMAAYSPQIARLLLEGGADVNARDNDGTTALMHAARGHPLWNEAKKIEFVKEFLVAGADVHATDDLGKNALNYALEVMNRHAVEYEVQCGLFGAKDAENRFGMTVERCGTDGKDFRHVPIGDGKALVALLEEAMRERNSR